MPETKYYVKLKDDGEMPFKVISNDDTHQIEIFTLKDGQWIKNGGAEAHDIFTTETGYLSEEQFKEKYGVT